MQRSNAAVGADIQARSLGQLGYRPDIAGLRAIAVLSVLLFHFKIEAFRGGFVGVDIFFVISGYLITRQILEKATAGQFSFWTFYARRMSRILPALIFTVAVTFLCGLLWLSPEFMRGLAKESTHALLSISNIQYWREANEYFAPKSDQLALLHFWSLSLEEQFYFVWPALILLSLRLWKPLPFIAFMSACSLLAALVWSFKNPQTVFFLMPFRIFEFGLGALVIFTERFRLGGAKVDTLLFAGLAAIAIGVFALGSTLPLLGVAVAIPSLGAAAIIQVQGASRLSPLIENRLFQFFGEISYSLYLCHWPILFFGRFIFGDAAEGVSGTIAMAVVTLAVGAAMYRFIEQPFRLSRGDAGHSSRKIVATYLASIAVLAVVSHTTFRHDGWPSRLSPATAAIAQLQSFGMSECAFFGNRQCEFGAVAKPVGVELVGDSYVQQYVAALNPILKELNLRGESSTFGGCPILIGVKSTTARSEECLKVRDDIFARLDKSATPILFSLAWPGYAATIVPENSDTNAPPGGMQLLQRATEETIGHFVATGHRVMLVGEQVTNACKIDRLKLLPGPLPHAPQAKCPELTKETALKQTEAINGMLRAIQAKWPDKITLLLPADYLCDTTCVLTEHGLWLYQDEGHLTVAGSRFVGKRADSVLRNFLSGTPRQ
ncbi:MAG: acyltransferase [Afipia sp.]|nr:acyltransferase [Afipia sp.]